MCNAILDSLAKPATRARLKEAWEEYREEEGAEQDPGAALVHRHPQPHPADDGPGREADDVAGRVAEHGRDRGDDALQPPRAGEQARGVRGDVEEGRDDDPGERVPP